MGQGNRNWKGRYAPLKDIIISPSLKEPPEIFSGPVPMQT